MNYRYWNSQRGLTLVELMISVALGLALMAGAITLFQQNKQTYNFQESIARLQENGRFALDMITRDIRSLGYSGCLSRNLKINNRLNNSGNVPFDFESGINGFDAQAGSWSPSVGADVTGIVGVTLLAGRDVLVTKGASGCYSETTGSVSSGASAVKVAVGSTCLGAGDIVMVSNCEVATIASVSAYTAATGTVQLGNTLLTPYLPGDEVVRMSSHIYFIKNGANGIPSLWRSENGAAAVELVEGVDDMQIEYGRDTNADGNVDVFSKASAVSNWSNVIAVRVNLLMMTTTDNILDAPQTYTFNGTSTSAPDNRIRKEFTTTIAIRNRLS